MNRKNKLYHFIKIFTLVIIFRTYLFNSNVSIFSKSMVENCKLDKKLYTRNYRSLSKYKQNNDSYIARLKEDIRNKGKYEKEDIRKNEKETKGKNSNLSRTPLNRAQYYTEVTDYNNGMFDGKHFHFEKKWIKKKDYDKFLEKNRKISDISLKKIKFRNYKYGVALLFFFFFVGIGIPLSPGLTFLDYKWKDIKKVLGESFTRAMKTISESMGEYSEIILFIFLMIILSIILILVIYKILRNNEKYNKIKLMSEYDK
ncbi:fam-m protein [Plasmodium malariae]|uniref:Fam-m protein n=1 Tax=Plasmodium malariae TaxID=5858 RepID=A0A1D3JGP9_PLAMA|nr:fam-m protein [Plasmodium malariae]SBT85466.1 fam-m protein [Plasmodium malariae]